MARTGEFTGLGYDEYPIGTGNTGIAGGGGVSVGGVSNNVRLMRGLTGIADFLGQGDRNAAIEGDQALASGLLSTNSSNLNVRDSNYQEIFDNPEGLALYESLYEAADRKTERNAARSGYQGNTGRFMDEWSKRMLESIGGYQTDLLQIEGQLDSASQANVNNATVNQINAQDALRDINNERAEQPSFWDTVVSIGKNVFDIFSFFK